MALFWQWWVLQNVHVLLPSTSKAFLSLKPCEASIRYSNHMWPQAVHTKLLPTRSISLCGLGGRQLAAYLAPQSSFGLGRFTCRMHSTREQWLTRKLCLSEFVMTSLKFNMLRPSFAEAHTRASWELRENHIVSRQPVIPDLQTSVFMRECDGMRKNIPPQLVPIWHQIMHKMTALLLHSHLLIQSSQASILNNFVQKDNHWKTEIRQIGSGRGCRGMPFIKNHPHTHIDPQSVIHSCGSPRELWILCKTVFYGRLQPQNAQVARTGCKVTIRNNVTCKGSFRIISRKGTI